MYASEILQNVGVNVGVKVGEELNTKLTECQ